MKRILLAGGAIIAAAALIWFLFFRGGAAATGDLLIETSPVEARDISRIVSSSGAIAPLITVEVGSQLSGQVLELHADFNDQVTAGDLLARIDPQTFQTRVEEAQATLQVASAQVSVADANLERARVDREISQRNFDRAQELVQRGTYSAAQYDAAESGLAAANAALLVAQANLRNSRASEQQRRASLESAEVDLERTFIRSPIEGVVIDRQIDEGQTVAASFNAPVLFLIAQDLSRIQIEAEIDEADIGQIDEGQTVTFDVDAYPDREFAGEVTQVRLAATNEGNVVTYTVVIQADNPGQRLLPGMTANVSIVTGQVEDAMSVPNAALRFAPRGAAESLVVAAENQTDGGQRGGRGGRGGAGMIDRLAEELELTDEQRSEAERALRETFQQMRAQFQNPAPGGARPNPQALIRRALSDILTSEQLARYDQMSQERSRQRDQVRRGSIWIETAEGRLQERQVGIGLSDGQYTQILGPSITETDRVVTRVRETNG
ncbi:efflux RND transporter periplasmic adaptor subunit [Oceanicaulis alexandrii]|uniref:efflux RND transporter periplasmic adaptor subunit n=1 Tax=Oceanicaulis alexandrii TaxID=153233 RepID=UPI0035D0CD5C